MNRVLRLPNTGKLLVSTDMHGNGEDFRRLCDVFLSLLQQDVNAQWVILGDIVHGPDPGTARKIPQLYGYEDESWMIVRGVISLQERYPNQVHFIVGNHDYGHIGGYRTSKFYDDEVSHLESTMSEDEVGHLRAFVQRAYIAAIAPCGAFLAHGAPEDCIGSLAELEQIDLPAQDHKSRTILRSLITSYGQPREKAEAFLRAASVEGYQLRFMIHGHDKDEAGFFVEGDNQLCPVLFGAPDENKRFVLLDLSAEYESVHSLQDGVEIIRLYPM
jgi:hypothetical protein